MEGATNPAYIMDLVAYKLRFGRSPSPEELYCVEYVGACLFVDDLVQALERSRGEDVVGLVKEFRNRVLSSVYPFQQTLAYSQAFLRSFAALHLVLLYISSVPAKRDIAKRAIGILCCDIPSSFHVQWAPILLKLLLQLRRLLEIPVTKDDVHYIACRGALARLLSAAKWGSYTSDLLAVVFMLPLFVGELTEKVLSGLGTEHMAVAPIVLTELSDLLRGMDHLIMHCKFPSVRAAWFERLSGRYDMEIDSLDMLFREFLSVVDHCMSKVENYMHQEGEAQNQLRMAVWVRTLVKVLSVLNTFANIFDGAEQEQLLHEVLLQRRVPLNFLLRRAKWNEELGWFLKHKDVLDFETKKNLVLMLLPKVKDEDQLHKIRIDRSQLLAESFEYICRMEPPQLHRGLSLKFKNETAIGPGVLREWFYLLCKMIFDQRNGFYLPRTSTSDLRRFSPNPEASDPLHLKYFAFSARVIGLALMHNVHLGIQFDPIFFKQLAGKPITLEDVKDVDPRLYQSYKQILEMDAGDVDSDALALRFAIDIEEQGSKKRIVTIELCPGGRDTIVNSKNREEYVNLLIQHRFVKSVSAQVAHFCQGFADILSDSKHQKFFFQILDLEDFDLILGGSGNVIDVEQWKAHTEYNGYKAEDRQISWFWKIVEGMSEERRRMLLFFWTSVMFLPIDGFGSLASKLCIWRSSSSQESLPRSYTCFYRLYLPPYETELVMFDRLQLITQEHVSSSFGLS